MLGWRGSTVRLVSHMLNAARHSGRGARTHHCEGPAIVAHYGGRGVCEDGYLEREGDEGEEYLGDVQAQLKDWEVLRVPFELAQPHFGAVSRLDSRSAGHRNA